MKRCFFIYNIGDIVKRKKVVVFTRPPFISNNNSDKNKKGTFDVLQLGF